MTLRYCFHIKILGERTVSVELSNVSRKSSVSAPLYKDCVHERLGRYGAQRATLSSAPGPVTHGNTTTSPQTFKTALLRHIQRRLRAENSTAWPSRWGQGSQVLREEAVKCFLRFASCSFLTHTLIILQQQPEHRSYGGVCVCDHFVYVKDIFD